MIIRVDTLENLISDTSLLLDKEPGRLLEDIKGFPFLTDVTAGYRYFAENKKEKMDAVYLCHTARKLDSDKSMRLLPLNEVLATSNSFSEFLKNHDIFFDMSRPVGAELIYHGKVVDWRKCENKGFNPDRFQSRLYKDFCVNGFQFLYDIPNSARSSYNRYSYAPEFLQDLEDLLHAGLVQDYRHISHTFVALCRMPIDQVLFDHRVDDESFEERYIYSALEYIWEYCCAVAKQGCNCILRGLDPCAVQVEKWISEEEIEYLSQPY